jgi:hypothetical protein
MNKSGMGMRPTAWGPPLWFFLHTVSMNYPVKPTQKHKRDYARFLRSLTDVLPCATCREHFTTVLAETDDPLHYESRDAFIRYVYDVHTRVNQQLERAMPKPPSLAKVRQNYETLRYTCPERAVSSVVQVVQRGPCGDSIKFPTRGR